MSAAGQIGRHQPSNGSHVGGPANSLGMLMFLVEIEKPENETLGSWFSELRDWLDVNHCEPAIFALTGRRLDRLIYRISFDSASLARQFTERFARYAPTVRRATAYERAQVLSVAAPPVEAAS
jgi:hypothetical protein